MSDNGEGRDHRLLMKKTLLELRELRSKISAMERAGSEPIAVIGMACRFPGDGNDPDSFWRLLRDGVDATSEVPPGRWDLDAYYDPDPDAPGKMYTRRGGFLSRVDGFDPDFFGISPRETLSLSPQQRLLLEVTWEAVENANQVPDRLFGSRTGVFVGLCGFDYTPWGSASSGTLGNIDVYGLTGCTLSVAAGRLSYFLGLTGPSLVVDTACSSSLLALDLACQSLRRGECDLALTGGVHLMLSPALTVGLCRMRALAPDGRCKTFDAAADGFARGEGCGMVALKRLSDAQAHGDRVLALIRASAVNQDGASGGLTVPSGPSQKAVIRRALDLAGVEPGDVDYIEAHGTGTALGDPIEIGALEGLCAGRPAEHPLLVGSVKTNIGHLEAAAGVAGLIKVVLSLQNEEIPPHLHFTRPNAHIPWNEVPVVVPTQCVPWPRSRRKRIAGVSSFGLSGTNVHVLVEEAPPTAQPEHGLYAIRDGVETRRAGPQLLLFSARSEAALRCLAGSYRDFFRGGGGSRLPLPDVCYTAAVRRTHHDHRIAVTGQSADELVRELDDFLQGADSEVAASAGKLPKEPPRLAFVFSGQGADWWAVGRELLDTDPLFRQTLERCDRLLRAHAGWSLVEELRRDEAQSRLSRPEIAQPAFFAVQVGLAALWTSWGIVPQAVVGHSVGEIAAAHVAGALDLEDAVRIVYHRGRLLQAETGRGRMAAVEMPLSEVRAALSGYEDRIAVATVNSPTSAILSGDATVLEEVLRPLEARDVLCRRLNVSFASHSPQMEPYRARLAEALAGLRPRPTRVPMISTVTGKLVEGESLDASYWGRNIRETVQFADAMSEIIEKGFATFVEIGPHPVLALPISQCAAGLRRSVTVVGSLRRGQDERRTLLAALGRLYVHGCAVDWERLHPSGGRCVPLPSYPWHRKRYDFTGVEETGTVGIKGAHPLLGTRLRSPFPMFETRLDTAMLTFLDDHRLGGVVLVPASVYLELLTAVAREVLGDGAHVLEDIAVHEALLLEDSGAVTVQTVLTPRAAGGFAWHVHSLDERIDGGASAWRLHASGTLRAAGADGGVPIPDTVSLETLQSRCSESWSGEIFYARLHQSGLPFGPAFRRVERVSVNEGEALARIVSSEPLEPERSRYCFHPVLLDACLHAVGALLPAGEKPSSPILLTGLGRFRLHRRPSGSLWSHVSLRSGTPGSTSFEGDVVIFDDSGALVAQASGLALRHVERELLLRGARDRTRDWLYEVSWERKPRVPRAVPDVTPGMESTDAIDPARIAADLRPRLSILSARHGHEAFRALSPHLENLSAAFVVEAFRALGWSPAPGETFSTEALARRLGVSERHRRLLERLLGMLQEECVLEREGTVWRVVRHASTDLDAEARLAGLMEAFPGCAIELEMTGRFGRQLGRVLRGDVDPLQLLFPEGSLAGAAALYRDSRFAETANVLVKEALEAAADHFAASSPIRVLELGAGTGGATSLVLPVLATRRCQYLFTDISALFLSAARDRFREFPFVAFERLDIDADPGPQGFASRRFDIVLASNVLHATRDLRLTLRHVRELMAPGGLLVLLEGTGPQRWIDLIFGTMEGWWRFEDADVRPAHPLISQGAWLGLLTEAGFEVALAVPEVTERTLVGQTVILAGRPATGNGPAAVSTPRSHWLVFADRGGVGRKLAELAEREGHRCLVVFGGDREDLAGPREFTIDPSDPAGYRRLLAVNAASPDTIVHLWSLDALPSGLPERVAVGCGSVLHLVQAMAGAPGTARSKLWLATRGGQHVGPGTECLTPDAATLWGMGRVVALEYPELWGGLVDLEGGSDEAAALLAECAGPDEDDQIAFRRGERHVARLLRAGDLPPASVRLRADGSYLVTGGLGGLGLLVAEWLVSRGARHLVLLGRSDLPDDRASSSIRAMESAGARVTPVSADVSDEQAMSRLFGRFGVTEPALRGIVHAAGLVDFRPLAEMDATDLASVLRAKVAGTWVLHLLTRGMALDFFVLFSSTTALWGSKALAHYAAANQFLDVFAHHRRALGLPALAIDWGLWERTGSSSPGRGDYGRYGLIPMPPRDALEVMGRLLDTDRAQAVVADVDWTLLKPAYAARRSRPLLSRIGPRGEASPPSIATPELLERLLASSPDERVEILRELVEGDVVRVLRLDRSQTVDPDRGFFDMGMDSLTAVDLKRRLESRVGRALPDTLTFNYPTVRALAGYLAGRLVPQEGAARDGEPSPEALGTRKQAPTGREHASEDELISLLAKKLRATDELDSPKVTG